jgi:hypothetical protein
MHDAGDGVGQQVLHNADARARFPPRDLGQRDRAGERREEHEQRGRHGLAAEAVHDVAPRVLRPAPTELCARRAEQAARPRQALQRRALISHESSRWSFTWTTGLQFCVCHKNAWPRLQLAVYATVAATASRAARTVDVKM